MEIEELDSLEKESIRRAIPIIGSEKGEWLLDKVKEVKPSKVLELGTANGYSGIILGSEGADITTIEQNPKVAPEAKANFEKFGINANILVGEGVSFVRSLADHPTNKESFDMIFIDFSKKNYIDIIEDCIKLVKVDGLIIADNIMKEDCQDYVEKVKNDDRLETSIVDIKDGLSVSKKTKPF